MIKKYIYGNPFPTEAVVEDIAVAEGKIQFFDTTTEGVFGYNLAEEDMVFGLGEQIRGINKRGWKYNNWNFDNPHHHEDTHSLYGAHNFIVVKGEETFGAFFDFAGNVTFDIGYTRRDLMTITPATMDLVVYIITGSSIKDIVSQFRKMIGRSYIPPMWAFGYGQSRWGYKDEKDIREVAAKYKSAGIPIDSIYMDIDYMDDYKDFTVSEERFPALSKLSEDMKTEGIHLVPIIDAGVKIEEAYDVYERAIEDIQAALIQLEDIACDSTIYPCLTGLMENYFDLHESLASTNIAKLTISASKTVSYQFTSQYKYIGIRIDSGAAPFESITFDWNIA